MRLVWIGGRRRKFDQPSIDDVSSDDATGSYDTDTADLINELKGTTNDILAALRNAGIIQPPSP